jgi:uncharacterized protein
VRGDRGEAENRERAVGDASIGSLPLFPLSGVLVPGTEIPLHVFEERYRRLMRDRRGSDPMFGVVLIRAGREVVDRPTIFRVGTAASLVEAVEHADGRYSIAVRGGRRFRVVDEDWSTGYLTATVRWLPEEIGGAAEVDRAAEEAVVAWRAFVAALARMTAEPAEADRIAHEIGSSLPDDPVRLAYSILAQLPTAAATRQRVLELDSAVERLTALAAILAEERRLMTALGSVPTLAYSPDRAPRPN